MEMRISLARCTTLVVSEQLVDCTTLDAPSADAVVRRAIRNKLTRSLTQRLRHCPPSSLCRYAEVQDVAKLIHTVEDYLRDHNGMSKRPMNLAMFLFAVEHVSRICRLLKQPGGHMLLVGVGGSGRQSLSRLAAFICGMPLFQVRTCAGLPLQAAARVLRRGSSRIEMVLSTAHCSIHEHPKKRLTCELVLSRCVPFAPRRSRSASRTRRWSGVRT